MTAGDAVLKIWNIYDAANVDYVQYDNYTNTQTSKLMDYEYLHAENLPKQLKVVLSNAEVGATLNLLSSGFVWSNGTTGAVDLGCYVLCQLAPNTTGAVAPIFFGTITDVQPDAAKGTLTLICKEVSNRFEGIKSNKLIFTNYRDQLPIDVYGTQITLPDSPVALPLVSVSMFTIQSMVDSANPASSTPDSDSQSLAVGQVCLPFIAQDDYCQSAAIYIKGDGTTTTWVLGIMADNGIDLPNGTWLCYCSNQTISSSSPYTYFPVALDGALSGGLTKLTKGAKYWLVIGKVSGAGNSYVGIEDTPSLTDGISNYYKYWNGSSYTTVNGKTINARMWYGHQNTIPPTDYSFAPSTGIITINKWPSSIYGNSNAAHNLWGQVSYYYTLVYALEVATELTALSQPLSTDAPIQSSVSMNFNKTFPLWRVGNNFVGASIRELCDNFCYQGGLYQGALGCYNSSWSPAGNNILKWSRRQSLADAPYLTLSNPPASDDQSRIISFANFRKTAKRPISVMVIGQDASGLPIVAHRDDRELGLASLQVMAKQFTTEYITDSNIQTLQQADEIARARLDLNVRNVWEGEITISGTYPNLLDIDPTSSTFGSGKNIQLTYPTLGLSGQILHVKQVRCTPNTTIIQVSNFDMLIQNRYNLAYDSASRSQTILAPTDTSTNVFAKFMSNVMVTTGRTMTMALLRSDGVAITSQVPTTWFWDKIRKTVVYHAEFEAGNGTTTDVPATWVNKAQLYAGEPSVNAALGSGYSFPKWSGTRVIVDFACWDGN